MSARLTLTQSQSLAVLRSFLLAQLAAGVSVVQGQDNYVPEPGVTDFIVMWPTLRLRLSTNVNSTNDVTLIGSVTGTVLTVTTVTGVLKQGALLWGASLATGTAVGQQLTGPTGGIGTYAVTPSQNVASESMAAGSTDARQATRFDIQLDVHGPASADNAQIIATLLRSEVACDFFTASGLSMAPLYVDDPRQIPFVNGESQFESRWIVGAVLQVNPTVSTPEQFADNLAAQLISVDATYPP